MARASDLTAAAISGSWTLQPLAILLAVAACYWYGARLRQLARAGTRWSHGRSASFAGGVLLLILVSCGPATHYGRSIYWIWTSQSLTLLLLVPLPLMCGQPIELARTCNPDGLLPRWADSSAGRWFSSPLVGPAVIPLIYIVTLFGPVPGLVAGSGPVGWLVQLLLVLIGSVILLPLVAAEDTLSSIAIGIAVFVGFFELLIDAVPGIVLRLSTHPVSSFFDRRHAITGAPSWLHDQQIGGGTLWVVAELLDLPFLLLVFRRWIKADAREAAVIDAALDEQQVDRPAEDGGEQPWFLDDPRMRDRFR